MDSKTPSSVTDPVAVVGALDADAIVRRLASLVSEARALRVLLRAARARERVAPQRRTRPQGGPDRAA